MKVSITSTDQIVNVAGVECRLWDGKIEGGGPCAVFVHRIASACEHLELLPQAPPANLPQINPVLRESVTREILTAHVQFVMNLSKLLTSDEYFSARVEERGGDGLQELFDKVVDLMGASNV